MDMHKNFIISKILFLSFVLSFGIFFSQSKCNISKSTFIDVDKVDANDLICLAKNSEKPYTIFTTFASWCGPCRLHLPDFIDLKNRDNVDLYVVLVEAENDKRIANAIHFVKSIDANSKMLVLKNDVYGKKKRRNEIFVKEITPKHNEMIADYGKVILIKNTGEILYVTNWKDYDKDWKNSQLMLEKKIIPLLK